MISETARTAALSLVAEHFGISPDSVLSADRHQPVAEARHVAIWLFKNYLEPTWGEIAEVFGQRSHTTSMRAYRGIVRRRRDNASLRAQTDVLAVRFRDIITAAAEANAAD